MENWLNEASIPWVRLKLGFLPRYNDAVEYKFLNSYEFSCIIFRSAIIKPIRSHELHFPVFEKRFS